MHDQLVGSVNASVVAPTNQLSIMHDPAAIPPVSNDGTKTAASTLLDSNVTWPHHVAPVNDVDKLTVILPVAVSPTLETL